MSVKKEPSGRRSVEVEVEVPGTPEEVWQAIATGPGVSSWFVPCEIDEREGTVVCDFGPGMKSRAKTTSWDPPRRFTAESGGFGPGAPTLATEWIVEAKSGGVCVVRVVHSLFASTDDWDGQLEATESGWPNFFEVLRLYLTHFRGLPCSTFRAMGVSRSAESEAWEALAGPLGLVGAVEGAACRASADAPPLAGVVDRVGRGAHPHSVLLRLDEPTPGTAFVFAHGAGGAAHVGCYAYLYGDRAADAVARDEPLWNAWMNAQFPMNGD
jgi:uncharacterized protein YndB with AHSA1/START domain